MFPEFLRIQLHALRTCDTEKTKTSGPPPLGIHLLMGDNARIKLANMVQNLKENRVAIVQAVVEKR